MTRLWGSRFSRPPAPDAEAFSRSIAFDQKLLAFDIIGGIAHAKMLGQTGVIPKKDAAALVKGLRSMIEDVKHGTLAVDPTAEDVHTFVQDELFRRIGEPARRLHTARSRNDQIVLDMALYNMDWLSRLIETIQRLQRSLVQCGRRYEDVIIPAYTHLQSAQLILWPHLMLAYCEMLERDRQRARTALDRNDRLPLGSGAVAGSTLPIDRHFVAKELGFKEISQNSVDTVSDRDGLIECAWTAAMTAIHLSRIAEDLIIYTTTEFGFVELDDAYCTGSSIMPHKKNPDILELVRGFAAEAVATLNQLLVLLKGLPHAYNRDLQWDKPRWFETAEHLVSCVSLMAGVFATLALNRPRLAERIAQEDGFYSVDIMEHLIAQGVSYREAHDAVGALMKDSLNKKKRLKDFTDEELRAHHPKLNEGIKRFLDPRHSVQIKITPGSTQPKEVALKLAAWEKRLRLIKPGGSKKRRGTVTTR